ncbi:MAG: hypothetical protein M0036_23200 [Desulfobacteraceae bacterium]|nr:hypothetical protein [Desulfobacteraceae bacterium]
MGNPNIDQTKPKRARCVLPDNATIAVVGGGPAGAFFAIQAAKEARKLNKKINLVIIEKKRDLCVHHGAFSSGFGRGCNYCAGGISPKLIDILGANGLQIPEEIIMGKTELITVHGDWKSIELSIPKGRKMYTVFRGSRPRHRADGHFNFDSFLIDTAQKEGATLLQGEVQNISYSSRNKPVVHYRTAQDGQSQIETLEADFVALAAGVNQTPGMTLESNHLYQTLRMIFPGFRPPKVRKALICELQTEEALLRPMRGEVHFAQYGSKDLQIEMSSFLAKGGWITLVLIGPSIDCAKPSQYTRIFNQFLELPYIRRLFPRAATFSPACVCNPNMTIGMCHNGFGHRVALIGDMVVSRLYKDGILSAYTTASALVDCIFKVGIDRASLKKAYWPMARISQIDNLFGAVVFLLNRITFSNPLLSRIFYQALLTERKSLPEPQRRLANILWRIASGDDTYRRILLAMCSPSTIGSIFVGGLLVTIRNVITEKIFDLNWAGFGRYPLGVPKENVEVKRNELMKVHGEWPFEKPPQFERMYAIKIQAEPAKIFDQLGKFGDPDRQYLKPRAIRIHRVRGGANQQGSKIRYDIPFRFLSFSITIEKVIEHRNLFYRVLDGFAKGGVLSFDIHEKEKGLCILSLYVAYSFPAGQHLLQKLYWQTFRRCFPAFIHDVVWNHALCQLKHIVEVT